MITPDLPAVESVEVDGDHVRIKLSNWTTVSMSRADADKLRTDPVAARDFLIRHRSPKGHKRP